MTATLSTAYIDLLVATLRNDLYCGVPAAPTPEDLQRCAQQQGEAQAKLAGVVGKLSDPARMILEGDPALWFMAQVMNQRNALTLVPPDGLKNVRDCVEGALREEIPGDLLEAGVFRGGIGALMRGVLLAHGDEHRKVWLADSFEGLPEPKIDQDPDDALAQEILRPLGAFQVSRVQVQSDLETLGLLDDRVEFLEGWFADTLPNAPVDQLAVLRLDGDYYESTRTALECLYPKLSRGGFLIIDDYGLPIGCRRAVDEFREAQAISTPIEMATHQIAFWRRED